MKSNVYVGPSLRRNDAIEYTRALARTGEGGLAGDFASINTPRFFHTSLRSKNSCAGPFAMETQKSHFFFLLSCPVVRVSLFSGNLEGIGMSVLDEEVE